MYTHPKPNLNHLDNKLIWDYCINEFVFEFKKEIGIIVNLINSGGLPLDCANEYALDWAIEIAREYDPNVEKSYTIDLKTIGENLCKLISYGAVFNLAETINIAMKRFSIFYKELIEDKK
jgi:hypothetical protein